MMIDPLDPTRHKTFAEAMRHEDLLVPIFRAGERLYELPSIHDIRARREAQLAQFHGGVKRFIDRRRFPVGLEPTRCDFETRLLFAARGVTPEGGR